MAAFTLMAVLKLVAGSAFCLGAASFPFATYSSSDTCPLEDGEGFDGVSLLSFSTKLAKKRSIKWQSSAQIAKVAFGPSMGKKCAQPKCYQCEKIATELMHGGPIDAAAHSPGRSLLGAFEDVDSQDDIMYHIQQAVIPASMKGGAFKFTSDDCQEFYGLRPGSESKDAPPVSCFRKRKGTVTGFRLSPEDVCKSCECSLLSALPGETNPMARFTRVKVDHLAILEQSLSEKVFSTFGKVLSGAGHVASKVANFIKNFARGFRNFVSAPREWLQNTENQRVALKVLKYGAGAAMAVSAIASGGSLALAPAAVFAVNSAFALAQAAHAKRNHATNKQVAGMLVLSIGVGAVTATLALPDETASWLLPGIGESLEAATHPSADFLETAAGAFNEAASEVADSASGGEKAVRFGLSKGPIAYYESKVWKTLASNKAKAESNPSTVSQVLALQAQLCEAATNEWAEALKASMSAQNLAGGDPQVACGMVNGAAVEAEMAAGRDALAQYEQVSFGTLGDFLGEPVPDMPGHGDVDKADGKQEYPAHWGEMADPSK